MLDDLFQEVFLNFLQEIRKNGLKKPESSKNLLYIICNNTCISYLRKLATYKRVFVTESDIVETAMGRKNPENPYWLKNVILDFLDEERHNENINTPLRLFLNEGYEIPKIAKLFQVSYPTMYRRLAVGLKDLRLYLQEKGILK